MRCSYFIFFSIFYQVFEIREINNYFSNADVKVKMNNISWMYRGMLSSEQQPKRLSVMAHVLNILWFAISFMIVENHGKVSAYSLVDRPDVSNSSEEYGYYNIYNKIDSLQKSFQTLETNVQRKNNMLRQVLQSITEMDDNIEMSDENSKGTTTFQPVQKKGKFLLGIHTC